MKPALIPPHDLWPLLLDSVRYALGRRTYIVSDTCRRLVAYGQHLEPGQLAQIADEIEAELARGRGGDPCDEREWRGLMEWIRTADPTASPRRP